MKITDLPDDAPPAEPHPETPEWARALYSMTFQVYQQGVVGGRTLTAYGERLTLAERHIVSLERRVALLERHDTMPSPAMNPDEEDTQPGRQ